MQKVNYIRDSEIAELFDEECHRKGGISAKYKNHPYFSFLTEDNCEDSEEEAFCNSFWDSRRG